MCGIAGIFIKKQVQKPEFAPILTKMADHLDNRGPDGRKERIFHSKYFTAHTRLSIIDLSDASEQPIENDRYILTYNGEIYNYKALVPDAISDTHALLQLITDEDLIYTLDVINGMYAFALYDKLTHSLTLVRDGFGIKPLYYYDCEDYIAYASTPAALTELKDKWELNLTAVKSYLSLGAVFSGSMFKGINPVEAAHYKFVDDNLNTLIRYYTPEPVEGTVNDLIDHCVAEIDQCKLASDVPVYLFLSGGVDSTFIASRCEGMGAIHLDSPEIQYARQAAEKFGLNLQTIDPSQFSIVQAHRNYVKCGEPSMAAHIPYLTSGKVSQFAKTAISANGADELFFGYDRTPKDGTISKQQELHIFRNPEHVQNQILQLSGTYRPEKGIDHARWFELMTYVQFDLNKTLDFASMAHGLEMRVPFLSRNLVNRALSLHSNQFFCDYGAKEPLKRYLKQRGFSNEFVTRPKIGFSLHHKTPDHISARESAWAWLHRQRWAVEFLSPINGRAMEYLKNSALSLMIWFDIWKNKIENY